MNSSAGALFLWQHFDTWLSFVVRYPYMLSALRLSRGSRMKARYAHSAG